MQRYLITGAGRGLGLEFTKQLLAQKKQVTAWVRNPESSPGLTELQAKYGAQLKIDKVDISQPESVAAATQRIEDGIDVLINNAGVLLDAGDSFSNLPLKKVRDTFEINVLAPMLVAQSLLPLLQKSSDPVLINISSKMGSITDNSSGGYYAYRMSKTAVNMFTKSFSIDFPQIKTFCVHPGWVQTDMGGAAAPTTRTDSITGLLKVIFEHQRYKSGTFVEFTGKELPW